MKQVRKTELEHIEEQLLWYSEDWREWFEKEVFNLTHKNYKDVVLERENNKISGENYIKLRRLLYDKFQEGQRLFFEQFGEEIQERYEAQEEY